MLGCNVDRTKPFVLLQFTGDGHDPIRRKAVPKKTPPQQSVEEKSLAAPPYAGYDLHIPVPHQPDKPIDRFFTLDNHHISFLEVDIHLTFVRAEVIPYLPGLRRAYFAKSEQQGAVLVDTAAVTQ